MNDGLRQMWLLFERAGEQSINPDLSNEFALPLILEYLQTVDKIASFFSGGLVHLYLTAEESGGKTIDFEVVKRQFQGVSSVAVIHGNSPRQSVIDRSAELALSSDMRAELFWQGLLVIAEKYGLGHIILHFD